MRGCRRHFGGHGLRLGALVSLGFCLSAPLASATLTLTLVTTPDLGIVLSGSSGRQFILNTNDTVSGANAADYISGAVSGSLTVADDASPATITILIDNISTAGGLTVNDALCSYDGGAQTSCDGAGMNVTSAASATLKVGLDLSTSTTHSGGDSASVTLDVSVSYL